MRRSSFRIAHRRHPAARIRPLQFEPLAPREMLTAMAVVPVGKPPTVTPIEDLVVDEDGSIGSLAFQVADPDTRLDDLRISVETDKRWIFPPENMWVEGKGAYRSLTLKPAANRSGTAVLTLVVDDGTSEVREDFTVKVRQVNDPPTTTGLPDLRVDQSQGIVSIDLFAAFEDVEDPDSELTYAVVENTRPDLFEQVTIDQGRGRLQLTLAPGAEGTTSITVSATDTGGLSVALDPLATTIPVFNQIAVPGLVTEDMGMQEMPLWTSWAFFENVEGQYRYDHLAEDQLRRVLEKYGHLHDGPVTFDIENPYYTNTPEGRDRFAEVLQVVREVAPDMQVGFYRFLPERNWYAPTLWRKHERHEILGIDDWWMWYSDRFDTDYSEWIERNMLYRTMPVDEAFGGVPLAQMVDHVNPSLYTVRYYRPGEEQVHWLKAWIDPTTDRITVDGPSFATVDRVYLVPSTGGRLPSGISRWHQYEVVNFDGESFQIAEDPGSTPLDLDDRFSGQIFVGAVGPWENPWLNPNVQNWRAYAEENIAEARKFGLPVYAWLSPSVSAEGDVYLDESFFRAQLEIVAGLADGIVIYEEPHHEADFHRQQGWWKALNEFLDEYRQPVPTFSLTVTQSGHATAGVPAGDSGLGYRFDGNDALDFGGREELKIGNSDYSLAVTFYIEPGSGTRAMTLVSHGTDPQKNGFELRYRGDVRLSGAEAPQLEFEIRRAGKTVVLIDPEVPDLLSGRWHEVVVTFDQDGQAALYLNGKLRQARQVQAAGPIDGGDPWRVGSPAGRLRADRAFYGWIRDVRVFHQVLHAGEVFHLYGTRSDLVDAMTGQARETARIELDEGQVRYRRPARESSPPRAVGNPGTEILAPGNALEDRFYNLHGDDFVDVGNIDALKIGNQGFTLSLWFSIDPGSEDKLMYLVAQGRASGGEDGYDLRYRGDYRTKDRPASLEFHIGNATTGGVTIVGTPLKGLVAGQWYHVLVTLDRVGDVRMYINGQFATAHPNFASGNVQGHHPFRIGRSNYVAPQYFQGHIGGVHIWHRGLMPDEVEAYYRTIAPGAPVGDSAPPNSSPQIIDRTLATWTSALSRGSRKISTVTVV